MGVPQPSHPKTLCRAGLSAPRSQEGGTDSCSHHRASRTRADSSLAQPQARLFWEGRRGYFCSLTTRQSISDLSLRPAAGAATEAALYPWALRPHSLESQLQTRVVGGAQAPESTPPRKSQEPCQTSS